MTELLDSFAGRFVRPAPGQSDLPGFLHRWPTKYHDSRAGRWCITPGWEHFCEMAAVLPEGMTVDPAVGIVWGRTSQPWYVWADHPTRCCTVECPACVMPGQSFWSRTVCSLWTDRGRDSLLSIGPGQHRCLVTPGMAAEIRDQESRRLAALIQAADQAVQQRDHQAAVVELLRIGGDIDANTV